MFKHGNRDGRVLSTRFRMHSQDGLVYSLLSNNAQSSNAQSQQSLLSNNAQVFRVGALNLWNRLPMCFTKRTFFNCYLLITDVVTLRNMIIPKCGDKLCWQHYSCLYVPFYSSLNCLTLYVPFIIAISNVRS